MKGGRSSPNVPATVGQTEHLTPREEEKDRNKSRCGQLRKSNTVKSKIDDAAFF